MKSILRLLGAAGILFGLSVAAAALTSGAGELQALFGIFALAGGLIVLVGGLLLALGALMGRGKVKTAGPALSPEQQQILDAREFLSSRRHESEDK